MKPGEIWRHKDRGHFECGDYSVHLQIIKNCGNDEWETTMLLLYNDGREHWDKNTHVYGRSHIVAYYERVTDEDR